MQDMMKMYNMYGMDPSMFGANGQTLVLNANNDLVKYIVDHKDGENTPVFCEQLYDLALLEPRTADTGADDKLHRKKQQNYGTACQIIYFEVLL